MPLIEVELKPRWTKHCVLVAADVENVNANFYILCLKHLEKEFERAMY